MYYLIIQKETIFGITDTNLYVLVVTLSTQDNAKQPGQLKSGFKKQLIRTNVNQNYQYKDQTDI